MANNNGVLPAFIDDGYTREFVVAPVPGLHGGLRGTFRPALDGARRDWQRKLAAGFQDGDEEAGYLSAIIVKHVKSWEGRAKVDEAGADCLHPDIRSKLGMQIFGYNGPERSADEKNLSAG